MKEGKRLKDGNYLAVLGESRPNVLKKEKPGLRQFHDTMMGGGAMPLELLERRVIEWIKNTKAATPPIKEG